MALAESIAWGPLIAQTTITTALSGSIVGLVLNKYIDRRLERERSARAWKEKVLSLAVGPVVTHLERTAAIAERYQRTFRDKTRSYLDAQLMRESNRELRAVVLVNGHLLPQALLAHAYRLVAHYDVWLARFDEIEAQRNETPDMAFDIGFVDVPFPAEAGKAFAAVFAALRRELYGADAADANAR